jgi:hypothetical protein
MVVFVIVLVPVLGRVFVLMPVRMTVILVLAVRVLAFVLVFVFVRHFPVSYSLRVMLCFTCYRSKLSQITLFVQAV